MYCELLGDRNAGTDIVCYLITGNLEVANISRAVTTILITFAFLDFRRILQLQMQAGPSSLNSKLPIIIRVLCILCFSFLSLIMYQLIPYLSVSSGLFDTWLSFIHLWQRLTLLRLAYHLQIVFGQLLSMHITVHHPVDYC
jgi:hypothetical protein